MADESSRHYLRRPIAVELRARDAGDTGNGEIMFDAADLSAGGAFLRSDLLLEQGDRLEVSFNLPGRARTLHTDARVAWVTRGDRKGEAGMGLQFIGLDDDERAAIDDFINRNRHP